MRRRIFPEETAIVGTWLVESGRPTADQTSRRIDELIGNYLMEVASSDGGWSCLYRDPNDGRYWELTYPDSCLHGGGAPQLRTIAQDEAATRYRI